MAIKVSPPSVSPPDGASRLGERVFTVDSFIEPPLVFPPEGGRVYYFERFSLSMNHKHLLGSD